MKDVIAQFAEHPDRDEFDPVYLQKCPLEGQHSANLHWGNAVRADLRRLERWCVCVFSVNHSHLHEVMPTIGVMK